MKVKTGAGEVVVLVSLPPVGATWVGVDAGDSSSELLRVTATSVVSSESVASATWVVSSEFVETVSTLALVLSCEVVTAGSSNKKLDVKNEGILILGTSIVETSKLMGMSSVPDVMFVYTALLARSSFACCSSRTFFGSAKAGDNSVTVSIRKEFKLIMVSAL